MLDALAARGIRLNNYSTHPICSPARAALLTGRNAAFETLRQEHGLSGFLRRSESRYDTFGAGHAAQQGPEHDGMIASSQTDANVAPGSPLIHSRSSCASHLACLGQSVR